MFEIPRIPASNFPYHPLPYSTSDLQLSLLIIWSSLHAKNISLLMQWVMFSACVMLLESHCGDISAMVTGPWSLTTRFYNHYLLRIKRLKVLTLIKAFVHDRFDGCIPKLCIGAHIFLHSWNHHIWHIRSIF